MSSKVWEVQRYVDVADQFSQQRIENSLGKPENGLLAHAQIKPKSCSDSTKLSAKK